MTKAPRIRKSISPDKTAEASSASKSRKLAPGLGEIGIIRAISNILSLIFRPIKKLLSFLVPRYFVNSWKEVKLVSWPNRRETWRLTLAVMVFAIVFGSMVAGVDKVLDLLFKEVILK